MLSPFPRTSPELPFFEPLPPLNAYEQALNNAWGKDGGAVRDALYAWAAHLVEGTDADLETIRRDADDVIASNSERGTSPAALVEECRIFFRRKRLIK